MATHRNPATWLISLPPWDGIRRLDTWLIDCLSCPATPRTRAISAGILLGMVERAIEPGAVFPFVFVIKGPQGCGKSLVFQILGRDWFSGGDIDPEDKGSLAELSRAWIYEISELGALVRADEGQMKRFLTRQEDEYRNPFADDITRTPRRNIFVGTTSEDEAELLTQTPFIAIELGSTVDLPALVASRDQLFAEALLRYEAGVRHDAYLAGVSPRED